VTTQLHIIADVIRTQIKVGLDIIGVLLDLLTGHWAQAWSDAKKTVSDAIHGVGQILATFAKGASTLLLQAGKNIIEGLVNGMKALASQPLNVIKSIGHGISGAFHAALHLGSPSKLFHQYGVWIVEGLVNGVSSKVASAKTASRLLAEGLIGGWTGEASKIKDALSTPLQNALANVQTVLNAALSKIEASLKTSQSKLKTLLSSRNSAIASLQQSLASGADLSNAFVTGQNGNQSYTALGNVGSFLSGQIPALRRFARDIALARKKGLDQALIAQITALGPIQGDQILKQIFSGADGSIASLNRSESMIQRYAKSAATATVESPAEKRQITLQRQSVAHERDMLHVQREMNRHLERLVAKDVTHGGTTLVLNGQSFDMRKPGDVRKLITAINKELTRSGGGTKINTGWHG
jgi:hypothetical protein